MFVILFSQLLASVGRAVEAPVLHIVVLCCRECRIPARDPYPTVKAPRPL